VIRHPAVEPSNASDNLSTREENPLAGQSMLAFVTLIALRSWSQMNMINYIPKFFSDLGYRPSQYGAIATSYGIGTALGGVAGGYLADRFGKKRVIVLSMVLSAVMLFIFPGVADSSLVFLVAPLAGAFTGAPHGILVVLAQHMLPNRVGAASGLVLGFTFASGAVGALVSGFQADAVGFTAVFLTTAAISALGAVMALQLKAK
jgi:FSR family fosmidomycin resistance protein-like MFS transporter